MSEAISLQTLLDEGLAERVIGDPAVKFRGVRHDSRRVEAGDLFVALGGQVFDGADYSAAAAKAGAVAIASEQAVESPLPVVIVEHGLRALAAISKRFYGDPAGQLPVIGITGTNGKTTVAYLVEQTLLALSQRPAIAGTIEVRGPAGHLPATHTTPMADDLTRICRWAVDSQASHFVTEVSSHGLAMYRVDSLRFAVAAFTNLSQDHLDFHGDLERYGAAKARLFRDFKPTHAVINIDDDFGAALAQEVSSGLIRYSVRGERSAELHVTSARYGRAGVNAEVATPQGAVVLHSTLLGAHNLENLVCALGICFSLGFSAERVAAALSTATGAPGRLQRVSHPAEVLVFVDYAHTPDALTRVCDVLRKQTTGRLLVVFGCGGDRDRGKRPLMAQAVAAHADFAVVTSDNPRTESPTQILQDTAKGFERDGWQAVRLLDRASESKCFLVEADRAAAIAAALAAAEPGDTVLVAGKGHENYQIIGTEKRPFDDVQVATAAIARLSEER